MEEDEINIPKADLSVKAEDGIVVATTVWTPLFRATMKNKAIRSYLNIQ